MVERVLLVVNTASGTGHGPDLVARLGAALGRGAGAARAQLARTADHGRARRLVRAFVERSEAPCAVIAGGGNGTLRAAVEGIADAVRGRGGADRVVLAALRLGSGNPFARHFGVPADPEVALAGVLENLRAGRLARCALLRCDVEDEDGGRRTLHATTMIGFGSFGRVPGDLERWRRAWPRLRRALARLAGLERLNGLEYAFAFALRALRDGLGRRAAGRLRLTTRAGVMQGRFVAGALVKLDVPGLPLPARVRAEEPAVALALVARPSLLALLRGLARPGRLARRAHVAVLGEGEAVRLERADGGAGAALFLDEDPAWSGRAATFRLSGTLRVAPGPGYRWPAPQGVTP